MVTLGTRLNYAPVLSDTMPILEVGRMRRERAERTQKVMKQMGVAALVATGECNVRYLTGFCWGDFLFLSYTLFFAEDDPIIFAHAGSYQQMPDQSPWIKHWRISRCWLHSINGPEAAKEEATQFAAEIREEMQKRGIATEKIGIVGFDWVARDALKEAGLNLIEGWPVLLEATKIKTVDEIDCLKMATSFTTNGYQKIADAARPGMTEGELRHMLGEAMAIAGSENPHGNVLSGPLSFERPVTQHNRRIEYGDLFYVILCGNSYMGYSTCSYRSFKMGIPPTDKEKDWYKQLKERLDKAIDATRIGNTTADAAKFFPPATKWGYTDEAEVLTVEIGHGIGLVSMTNGDSHYNLPVVNRQWSLKHPQPFEEGMVVAYESLEGEHRVGGVRLEDVVLITKNGPEIMDFFPRDEITVVRGV